MLKNFLSKTKRKLKFALLPKLSLAYPTVFINKGSWKFFDREKFKSDEYNLVCAEIERVKPDDLSKIVAYIGQVDKKRLSGMTKLNWLQLPHHGFNGFDRKSLYSNSDVSVSNVKDVFSGPIAQFCLAAYYSFGCYALRNVSDFPIEVSQCCGFDNNLRLTIIGLGNIGMCLAELAKNQGWTVYGVKRSPMGEASNYLDGISTPDNMYEFVLQSDLVVNLLPQTEKTLGFYNIDFFKHMKREAVFINVGRGSAVVDSDIEYAVNSGMIRGAVLDAASKKKYKAKNIVVTGHMSSLSGENNEAFDNFYTAQLKKYLSGETPENTIPLC